MTFSVEDALDRHVATLNEERVPDGHLHPSGLFGCARKAVYDFTGTPKSNPPDKRTLRVFRMGNIIHEFVQAALLDHPDVLMVFNEVKVVDLERNLEGHADSLILLKDGSWLVVELKSMNSNAFRYLAGEPKTDHRLQAATYLSILRRWGGTHVIDGVAFAIPPLTVDSRVRFAYISKDDMKVEEFVVDLTPEIEAEIEQQLFVIETAILEHELPDRLPNVDGRRNKLCNYCDWKDTCWSNDN